MADQLVQEESLSSLALFSAEFPRVTKPVTVASGEGSLAKGTVLGKVTATGEYKAYDNTANDGSETAKLILADAIDATDEAVLCSAYMSGVFNPDALTGLDDNAKADFDGTPILLKDAK